MHFSVPSYIDLFASWECLTPVPVELYQYSIMGVMNAISIFIAMLFSMHISHFEAPPVDSVGINLLWTTNNGI